MLYKNKIAVWKKDFGLKHLFNLFKLQAEIYRKVRVC